ncbi:hypothetical protein [Sorangium cellulosum]|uniref:hypothetical protein n=1 Tax=Sorangium TaxID=39643 RepID=UPI0012DB32DD|nr:hypothetical protein [Sorangium cellulosum]
MIPDDVARSSPWHGLAGSGVLVLFVFTDLKHSIHMEDERVVLRSARIATLQGPQWMAMDTRHLHLQI